MAASVHEGCLLAVQAILQGLTLAGLPAAQVYGQFDDSPLQEVFPNVVASVVGERDEDEPFDTEHDYAVYRIKVSAKFRVSKDDVTGISPALLLRQQLRRALRRQPGLPGVPEVWRTTLEAGNAAEFDRDKYQEYQGDFVVACHAAEPAS